MRRILLLAALILAWGGSAARGQTTLTLHFPEDRSLGRLFVISDEPDGRNTIMGPAWWWDNLEDNRTEEIAQLKGSFVLPVRGRLGVLLYSATAMNSPDRPKTDPLLKERIQPLEQFAPDRLEALTIQGEGGAGGDALATVAKLTSLKRLTLIKTGLTPQRLGRLKALRGLESLVISQSRLEEPEYAALAELKTLRRLSLIYTGDVTSASMAALARLTGLEHLILGSGSKLDARGLDHLARLPNLRTLSVAFDGKTGSRNLAALAQAPRLERLFIAGISPDDLRVIGNFSVLKGLRLYSAYPLTEGDLGEIARIKGLEELFLEAPVESEGLGRLAGLASLKILRLAGKQSVTSQGLAALTGLPALESFSAGGLPRGSLPLIAKMAHLKHINVDDSGLRPGDLDTLAGLKNLESMCVTRGIDEEMLAHVAHVQSLRRLTLSVAFRDGFSGVTSAGLAHLRALPRLESFECYYSQVFGDGLAQLATIPTLKRIEMPNTPYPLDEDVIQLARLKHLEELYLHGTYLSDKSLEALATIPTLRRLEFLAPGPEITPAGLERLRRAHPDIVLPYRMAQQILKARTPDKKYLERKARLVEDLKRKGTGAWFQQLKTRLNRR